MTERHPRRSAGDLAVLPCQRSQIEVRSTTGPTVVNIILLALSIRTSVTLMCWYYLQDYSRYQDYTSLIVRFNWEECIMHERLPFTVNFGLCLFEFNVLRKADILKNHFAWASFLGFLTKGSVIGALHI